MTSYTPQGCRGQEEKNEDPLAPVTLGRAGQTHSDPTRRSASVPTLGGSPGRRLCVTLGEGTTALWFQSHPRGEKLLVWVP